MCKWGPHLLTFFFCKMSLACWYIQYLKMLKSEEKTDKDVIITMLLDATIHFCP